MDLLKQILIIVVIILVIIFFLYRKNKLIDEKQLDNELSSSLTVKPYIFNNYEKTLPEKPKGYYKSFPAKKFYPPNNLKHVDGIQLTIDLTGVLNKEDLFKRFYIKFGFPYDKGDKASWDSFGDNLWFIKSTSAIFQEINPKVIHVVIENIEDVKKYSHKDYEILSEILDVSEDNTRFSDDFQLIITQQ